MDADGDGEKSTTTFRWINVARYVLASAMTVLILTVVVIAIKVVFRPDTLVVRVLGGFIYVEKQPGLPPNNRLLLLQFTIRSDNPSGRAAMYYYNVRGYLFDKNTSPATPDPQRDCFFSVKIDNMTLQQQQAALFYMKVRNVGPNNMTPYFFDMLYNNRSPVSMDEVTMRIEGYLVTEPISGYNRSARWTTYYCSPLIVGWVPATTTGGGQDDDEANKSTQGGSGLCTEVLNGTVTSVR